MHRIKGIDPHKDTLEKIKTLQPLSGIVLDTATGLGYTAIEAAKYASKVITIEIDPAALRLPNAIPGPLCSSTTHRSNNILVIATML